MEIGHDGAVLGREQPQMTGCPIRSAVLRGDLQACPVLRGWTRGARLGHSRSGWGSRRLGLRGAARVLAYNFWQLGVDLGPGHPSGETEAGRAVPPSAPEPSLPLRTQSQGHGTTILKYSPAAVLGLPTRSKVAQKPRRFSSANRASKAVRSALQPARPQARGGAWAEPQPPSIPEAAPGTRPAERPVSLPIIMCSRQSPYASPCSDALSWSTGGQMAPGGRVRPAHSESLGANSARSCPLAAPPPGLSFLIQA